MSLKLIQVDPKKLKGLKFNPAIRTQASELTALKDSIFKDGIQTPVQIDKDFNIIDGHRRTKCALLLNFESIPAIMNTNPKLSTAQIFELVNTTSRKLGQKELMYVFFHGGTVPATAKAKIQKIEALVGRPNLKKLAENYVSPGILGNASAIAFYTQHRTDEFMAKAIMWLVNHKMNAVVRSAMEDGMDKVKLAAAVNSNKPLVAKFDMV